MKNSLLALLLVSLSACAVDDAGGSESASSLPPASGAATPTSVPVLAWGFEPASADCNGWPVLGATAIRAAPPRSGAYSCKICSDGSANEVALTRDVGAVQAGRFVLDLWVRKRMQNASPPEARARLDANLPGGVVSASAPSIAVRDAWDRLEVKLDLQEPASNLRLTVDAPTPEGERCLFVDDVVLTRE